MLGILVLILIYIIKPNFQQKFVSSTFVWKLSLKYRKKRIPINKLRNLLLILCQVLILTSCALILAKPIIKAEQPDEFTEKIVIIDASVGMKSTYEGTTRFQRAVGMVKDLAEEVLTEENGKMTIIIAGDDAYMLELSYMDMFGSVSNIDAMRLGPEHKDVIVEYLEGVYEDQRLGIDEFCTFGSADIEGAMLLAEDVLAINRNSDVLLYTGTQYTNKGIVNVVDVKKAGERNAAILSGTADINEFYTYTFKVDVAVYGQDVPDVQVKFTAYGANSTIDNPSGVDLDPHIINVSCIADQVQTVEFNTYTAFNDVEDENSQYEIDSRTIYNYDYVYVEIDTGTASTFVDVLPYDNSFYFYGGSTQPITVQYASKNPSIFSNSFLATWQQELASKWNVVVDEVQQGEEYLTEGYDIYVFEHEIPTELPDDGIVIIMDPNTFRPLTGLSSLGTVEVTENDWNSKYTLSVSNKKHPIMKHMLNVDIGVTRAKPFYIDGAGWESLMNITYYDANLEMDVTYPIVAVMNDPVTKVVVMGYDIHYSDASMKTNFPLMMMDVFEYFFPATMTDFLYEIGETATFNSFSNGIDCRTPAESVEHYSRFPATIFLDQVGTFTLTQSMLSGQVVTTQFYVKTPAKESNVLRVEDELDQPYLAAPTDDFDKDLLIWFAAALVALLFAEWWLQSRDQF